MANWNLIEVSCDEKSPVRDWRRRAVSYPSHEVENNKLTVDNAVFIATLISISKKYMDDCNDCEWNLSFHCPVCPQKKAIWDTLTVIDHLTRKNFIAQTSCSIHRSQMSEAFSHNIVNEIINYVKESKKRISKFNTACMQAFNVRKKWPRNWFFLLLGCSPKLAPRGKNSDLDMGTLRLKEQKMLI